MIEYEPYEIADLFLGRSSPMVDDRGSFVQTFAGAALRAAGGPPLTWVELNQSRSRLATIRGLHFRRDLEQWKQIVVARGVIFDVVIDLRPASATYRRVVTVRLSATTSDQVIIPPGCAHGFQALSDDVWVCFNSTVASAAALEGGFRYDDPATALRWPLSPPVLSERDALLPSLNEVAPALARAFDPLGQH